MVYLLPVDLIPLGLQPLATLCLSWFVLAFALNQFPASACREYLTVVASLGFAFYWFLVEIGVDLGHANPYFGKGGLGDEAFFVALMLLVFQSFQAIEEHQLRRLVYVGRLHVEFEKSGPTLTRTPPLIETAGAKAAPPAE